MALNKFQQEIINQRGSADRIVVDACPGSGKTYTVENLVEALLADGHRLGLFTFSRKAAEEMRVRIAERLFGDLSEEERQFFRDPFSVDVTRAWIEENPARRTLADWTCTIHGLSYRLLKAAGQKPRVLSGKNAWEIKGLIKDKAKEIGYGEGWKSIEIYFNHATNNLIEPNRAEGFYNECAALRDVTNSSWHAACLAKLYQLYCSYCQERNLIDFSMMQARVIKKIRTEPGFTKKLAGIFDYVIIDEAQDTNDLQMEIIDALLADGAKLILVGDVDQSMYAFRGARPEVLQSQEANRFPLPINYRSTREIISSAAGLIKSNYLANPELLKPFEPKPDAMQGEPLEIMTSGTVEELGLQIAQTIQSENFEPGHIFLLSRTRAECALLHTELLRASIPAINKSGGLLFGAPHIKKTLAYAQLTCDYNGARDNLEVLGEIANVATKDFLSPVTRRNHKPGCNEGRNWIECGCPIIQREGIDGSSARYYGKKSIERAGDWEGIIAQANETNKGDYPTLAAKGAWDLVKFVNRIEGKKDNARLALLYIIEECIIPWMEREDGLIDEDPSENGLLEDFDVLLQIIEQPDQSLHDYLAMVETLTDDNPTNEETSVLIGTFHWSKGAERPIVFVNATRCPIIPPKAKEGRLPTGKPATIAEERRLIYVGITRAQSKAYLAAANSWNHQAVDSQFMTEIGREIKKIKKEVMQALE